MKLAHHEQLDEQRAYYADPTRKARMAPGRTPVVTRHLESAIRAARLSGGDRVLELGCGMGRFTALLAEAGFAVTGIDLSPALLDVAREHCAGNTELLCCDATAADEHVEGPFDAVLGFFFLHHLPKLEPVLSAARRLLRPGGRLVFIEPNSYNPLFYVQVLLTPGMSLRNEPGLHQMRSRILSGAFHRAALEGPQLRRYGFFPPAISNRPWGRRVESVLERVSLLGPIRPYQVIRGSRRD